MNNISIILVNTSHPGNIGSAARAMKNMGLKQLILVNPKVLPNDESYALAAGATDILDTARITQNLEEAIADSHVVFGCSARQRSLSWPTLALPDASKLIHQAASNKQTAIVFGSEQSGLSNQALQHCHYHLYIPANPEYSSLNLSQAVQVVTYAIFTAGQIQPNHFEGVIDEPIATMGEFEHFFQRFSQLIEQSGFAGLEPNKKMQARMRRLFQRAQMRKTEVDILEGILKKLNS